MKQLLSILVVALLAVDSNAATLEEFETMFTNNVTAADSYVLPVSNAKLIGSANTSSETSFGSFDFIIVGAGAAGALLANRLTEVSNVTVLLLEAGGNENNFSDIIGVSIFTQFSDMNWGYNTTVQTHAGLGMANQTLLYPRGKVMGGSSTIGEGMFTRGNPADYDYWAELGCDGWSYSDVLPYFMKTENATSVGVNSTVRGTSGLLQVELITETPMCPIFLNGSTEAGLNVVDTNDGYDQNGGVSKVQFNTKNNQRASAGRAFIDNYRNRTNLNITQNAFVIKINIDNSTMAASGVKFVKDNITYVATANKEVILSAGAVNTPQLLMLSGIGPKSQLDTLGIDNILDLPVGQNLQDHMYYYALNFRTNHTFYENATTDDFLQMYLNNTRPLTAGLNVETIGFFKTNDSLRWPDVEMVMISPPTIKLVSVNYLNLDTTYQAAFTNNATTDFLMAVMLLHPKSVGNITLKSSDPVDFPIINPNYLNDENDEDIATIYKGIQFVLNLTSTSSFQSFDTTLKHPSMPTCTNYTELSQDWWYCAIRTLTTSLYHPIGTTSMGNSTSTSVVNNKLMVHNMTNLRVVDAGVMPAHITGHLLGPVYMIAEKAADIIKDAWSLSD